MTMRREQRAAVDADLHTGMLPKEAVDEWLATDPPQTSDLAGDREHFRPFWQRADQLIHMLPGKSARNATQQRAAQAVRDVACEARERFLGAHADGVYSSLTRRLSRFVRVEDLILAAADTFPGLVPTRAQLAAEIDTPQKDKDGLEIEQGIFISHLLAQERAGRHLCHAMLLQHPRTKEALARFEKNGALDLDTVRLERRGRAVHMTM